MTLIARGLRAFGHFWWDFLVGDTPELAVATAALVLVAVVGLVVARQLSEVPENTIKTLVGVMLTSFGVFWVGEGAGVHWPGDDLSIPVLVGFFVVVYLAFTAFMRTQLPDRLSPKGTAEGSVVTASGDGGPVTAAQ